MSVLAVGNGFGSNPLWYLTRSTGVVAFVLLTATTMMGVAATRRSLASRSWPRFATQQLHRNTSLLATAFLALHVVTTLLDTYVRISWWSVVIPFTSDYRRFAVTLGTVALDLLVLITVSSLIRTRLPERTWRALHLSSYALWPLALAHFVLTGTDGSASRWGFYLGMACLVAVVGAAAVRLASPSGPTGPVRSVAGPRS